MTCLLYYSREGIAKWYLFSGTLEPAHIGLKELVVSFLSQFCVQSHQICGLKSDMVGNSQHGNQQTLEIRSVFPGELVVKYLPAKNLLY